MSSKYGYTLLAAAAFALAGCGGGGGGYNGETSNGAGTALAVAARFHGHAIHAVREGPVYEQLRHRRTGEHE